MHLVIKPGNFGYKRLQDSFVLRSIISSTIYFVNYNEIYHVFILPATAYSTDD